MTYDVTTWRPRGFPASKLPTAVTSEPDVAKIRFLRQNAREARGHLIYPPSGLEISARIVYGWLYTASCILFPFSMTLRLTRLVSFLKNDDKR